MCNAIEGLLGVVLFIFNLILGVAGLCLFVVAIIAAVEFRKYADEGLFNDSYLWAPVGLAIAAGIIMILLCIFGIAGLCKKKKVAIKTYLIILMTFLGLQIAIVTNAFTSRKELQESAEKSIRAAIPPAFDPQNTNSNTAKVINELQREFDCCGGFNATDYPSQNRTIPESCCKREATGCVTAAPNSLYDKGCGEALFDKFEDRGLVFISVGITIVVLQVLAFFFGMYQLSKDDGVYV